MKSVLCFVLIVFTLSSSINCEKNLNSITPNEYGDVYYPLSIGNQWTYNEQYPNTEIVVDTMMIGEKIFYNINGSQIIQPDFLIRESNNAVYFFDLKGNREHLIFNFNANSGDSWDMPDGFGCFFGDKIKLISKSEVVKTPAGTFNNCYHFQHEARCMDGGLRDSWFAKGIGIVKTVQDSWIGYVEFVLVSYKLEDRN